MNTTKLHIIRLLDQHGLVSVPGLGVFSSAYRAARIEGGCIYPPGKVVSFDTYSCSSGDDKLAASISRACGVDAETALQIIAEDVDAIRAELRNDGFSVIGNAGRLEAKDGAMEFVAAESFTTNPWLAPVELEPVAEHASAESGEVAARMDNEVFMRSLRRTASSAAAIAIFAFVAFIFSQLPRSGAPEPQMASIGFEQLRHSADGIFDFSAGNDDAPLVLVLNTPADGVCDVEPREAKAVEPSRYCLVVASLATRAEAEQFASEAGLENQVLEKDGRYRVFSHTSDNYAELLSLSRESSQTTRFPSAWICRR